MVAEFTNVKAEKVKGTRIDLRDAATPIQETGLVRLWGSGGQLYAMDQSGNVSKVTSTTEKSWGFASPAGASGTFYFAGFYVHAGSASAFAPQVAFGTANASYAAHLFVVLGAAAVDDITITVMGTRIDDEGNRTESYEATITIPSGTQPDTYFETSEKFIGQVQIEQTVGTAKTCDYGWSKYWDNNNTKFRVAGLEATWLGGGNDSAPNLILRHHKATGWTYTGSGATPPTPIAAMATDHSTEKEVRNGEEGSWKRTDLGTDVDGDASEGIILEVVTTANNSFRIGNFLLSIRAQTP